MGQEEASRSKATATNTEQQSGSVLPLVCEARKSFPSARATSLTSSPLPLPFTHLASAALAQHIPTSGPLHVLFPLPGMLFLLTVTQQLLIQVSAPASPPRRGPPRPLQLP